MFYKIVKIIAYPIARLLLWYKVVGVENIPANGKAIICCNHVHAHDIPLLVLACPRNIHFMAKAEFFENKLVAWFFKKMGAFPIIRGAGGLDGINSAIEVVKNDDLLGIFPEGTRKYSGRPSKGKAGIALILSKVDAPVIPTAIYYKSHRKIFTRAIVSFGKPIGHDKLVISDDKRADIRRVSETVMDSIIEEWDKYDG